MQTANRPTYAAAGVLATLIGMAAGHLVAAATNPSASPVLAVGSTVIDATPTPIKEWAIAHFGTHDKPILIGSVLLVSLVFAGVCGLLARRDLRAGMGGLLVLVALAGAAAITRPAATLPDLIPTLTAAVVGPASLAWLVSRMRPLDVPGSDGTTTSPSRRGLLISGGVLAVAAAVFGEAGQRLAAYRTRPGQVDLPAAAKKAGPFPTGLDDKVKGISPFRTPTEEFYRVDTRLALPAIAVDGWSLTIDGDVDRVVSFSFDDLAAMPLEEHDITLTCVSNDVGGQYVGAARWLGVPLTTLLDKAGIKNTRADQILSTDVDGLTISTPLKVATDGRPTMIALGMNGGPLPQKHGFPARMVTPGLYGFVGCTKWVERLTLTTYADQDAYWTKRGWATEGAIKVSSRIDTPQPLATVKTGDTFIGGVAWAQGDGIKKVEVRIDGGPWQQARLGPSAGVDYWRQWYLPWKPTQGQHMLAVRATTMQGEVQTAARAAPFPDGSSGIQEIVVTAA
ncbi:MAG: molybdopterin-dependent oxidoreductase [Nocardioides sp.]